ncbi:MAG: hypothetical protein HQK49_22720 [Oligoflexia bacterium]|nr:hypothetical protein [Oligoflexia bacterium]
MEQKLKLASILLSIGLFSTNAAAFDYVNKLDETKKMKLISLLVTEDEFNALNKNPGFKRLLLSARAAITTDSIAKKVSSAEMERLILESRRDVVNPSTFESRPLDISSEDFSSRIESNTDLVRE